MTNTFWFLLTRQIFFNIILFYFIKAEELPHVHSNTGCKQNYKEWELQSKWERTNESTKEWVSPRPKTQDQSNNDLGKDELNFTCKASSSSKVQSLHSVHHIHSGTRFQTEEKCFLNQFLCPDKWSTTLLNITHWTPNAEKTKVHTAYAMSQCNNKLSIVSPLLLHMQHLSTRVIPLSMRL